MSTDARAYYNEWDSAKAHALRAAIADGLVAPGDVDERSIEDVRADDLVGYAQCHFFAGGGIWSLALRRAGVPDSFPVWTASCPCQPFSVSGKRGGKEDSRHLWPVLARLIESARPVMVIGEQVASPAGLGWFDDVQADLERAGYTSGAVDACAAGFGAPHIRQRLYWAGWLDGAERRRDWGGWKGGVGGLADAPGPRLEGATGPIIQIRDSGFTGGGDVVGLGLPPPVDDILARDGDGALYDAIRATGAVGGVWSDAHWVLTRPQRLGDSPRLRPIKPDAFPLADGVPGRVHLLRLAGDAIVLPQAQTWAEVVIEEAFTGTDARAPRPA